MEKTQVYRSHKDEIPLPGESGDHCLVPCWERSSPSVAGSDEGDSQKAVPAKPEGYTQEGLRNCNKHRNMDCNKHRNMDCFMDRNKHRNMGCFSPLKNPLTSQAHLFASSCHLCCYSPHWFFLLGAPFLRTRRTLLLLFTIPLAALSGAPTPTGILLRILALPIGLALPVTLPMELSLKSPFPSTT